jgi:hypothetical protein
VSALPTCRICTFLQRFSATFWQWKTPSFQGGEDRNEETIIEDPRRNRQATGATEAAETREAERIGRIALKAGLGGIVIDESELQARSMNYRGGFAEASRFDRQEKRRGGPKLG